MMVATKPRHPEIDFEKLHSALRNVNLLDCQGFVVRVSGQSVESSGPTLGLGELCGIQIRDGRRVLAEVVGFKNNHLILLPLEHIEGISLGDTVTARTTPRHITLSDRVLGRVLNGLGEPMDGFHLDTTDARRDSIAGHVLQASNDLVGIDVG